MKKLILSFLFFSLIAVTPSFVNRVYADICVAADPDFDAGDCVANGGTVGIPIGIGGGPGGAGGAPIDGGLSVILGLGGLLLKGSKSQRT